MAKKPKKNLNDETPKNAIEAVAMACASVDGYLGQFLEGRGRAVGENADCYDSYMADAEEILIRLRSRGYDVVKVKR